MTSAVKDFLIECTDDYVCLSKLISLIWDDAEGEENAQEVRRQTLAVIADLLEKGLITAGLPTDDGGFEVWRVEPEQIIERIEREWDQLGREPNIGDIVWFTSTEKGDKEVEKLSQMKSDMT